MLYPFFPLSSRIHSLAYQPGNQKVLGSLTPTATYFMHKIEIVGMCVCVPLELEKR